MIALTITENSQRSILMAQLAIIHTSTRVIRRVTVDVAPAVAADETAVAPASTIDLAGGPWKLDGGNNKVAATTVEAQAAGMDPSYTASQAATRQAAYRAAVAALAAVDAVDVVSIGSAVTLTNVGSTYDATDASRGLGFAVIDFTGLTSIVLDASVNKIGTGTISWQVWNETDGAELFRVDDAGAAGVKTFSQTFTGPFPAGVKKIRIRCKSTVATDDPVWFGACLRLARPSPKAFFAALLALLP